MEMTQTQLLDMFSKQIEIAQSFDDGMTAAVAAYNRNLVKQPNSPRRFVAEDQSFVIAMECIANGEWQVSTIGIGNDLHIDHYVGTNYNEANKAFKSAVAQ
jgi:hypothetical protein